MIEANSQVLHEQIFKLGVCKEAIFVGIASMDAVDQKLARLLEAILHKVQD